MIKVVTVVGARPQIIKAAALSRAIKNKFSNKINEVILHTGQHYDEGMSQIFFDELQIPAPQYNLSIGSDTQGKQAKLMTQGIEAVLLKEKPNAVIVYGDTNSTLAGALVASQIKIPVIHIEAGLRSFNNSMPEEFNRVTSDHVSTLLFSPTVTGYNNLLNEGFKENSEPPYTINNPKIYHCGDVMYDNSLYFYTVAEQSVTILKDNSLEKNNFVLATIHRNSNTDEPKRLNAIFTSFNKIAKEFQIKIVIPLHPRTAKVLEQVSSVEVYKQTIENKLITLFPPISFLEMIVLEKNASLVITDSGGVQKEACFFQKPSIVLRTETEWIELVESGVAKVCDTDEGKIMEAFTFFRNNKTLQFPLLFGDGKAAEFICEEIIKHIH